MYPCKYRVTLSSIFPKYAVQNTTDFSLQHCKYLQSVQRISGSRIILCNTQISSVVH